MKGVIKIALTNWVNILTVYLCLFISILLTELAQNIVTYKVALYNTFGSLIIYYIHFWLGFSIVIALLDILLFSLDRQQRYINYNLLAEWILISSPLIYWFTIDSQGIYLMTVIAFLIGQFLRKLYIIKILLHKNKI